MTNADGLEILLADVRAADRGNRIELRDRVAGHGAAAIGPMTAWLDDRELSRFAVRVLERVGGQEELLEPVVAALRAGHEDAASPDDARDIEAALGRLGSRLVRPEPRRSRPAVAAPPARPGQPRRRYWAMRTSQSRSEFIWAEVRGGRLRQGWGWMDEQDLRKIAARRKAGIPLSPEEQAAWRARRMLGTEPDGVRIGDLVVTQNLPRAGRISVCRVVGPYDFDLPTSPEDFGHVLPVELVVEDVGRHDASVSDALRHAISLPPRLYAITPYGGEVEALVADAH